MNNECFSINNLDLVFGKHPEKIFYALDNGKSRDQIHKEFNNVVAVRKANFNVYQGEILAIMGLSGSGKSSLLRCLNGMNGRSNCGIRGSVKFKDPSNQQLIDIIHCTNKELMGVRKHKISMVFQQFGLMPWKTVEQNVDYPL